MIPENRGALSEMLICLSSFCLVEWRNNNAVTPLARSMEAAKRSGYRFQRKIVYGVVFLDGSGIGGGGGYKVPETDQPEYFSPPLQSTKSADWKEEGSRRPTLR